MLRRFLGIAGLSLAATVAQAASEDAYLRQTLPSSEQTVGIGRSALWTLPHVATQYQPSQITPGMQAALQAQQEGRFLEALILLEEAGKSAPAGADARLEIDLLRASFLLQGNQSREAAEILAPLLADARHAADAHALAAMAFLEQGQTQQALEAARRAQDFRDGILPHLALSYALQGAGRLAEARDAMHSINARPPQRAVALAREAELALTLGQVQPAVALARQAQGAEAGHPYVVSVSGLAYLINGQAQEAKAAFETALRRDPRDAKALLGLGLADIRLGNLQAGLKNLQAANEAAAGDALILTYLGRAQQQLGQTGAAMESWFKAQDADPRDPVPWLYQAQAELQANRPQDARESLREAQARTAYRSVYRGARLIGEDEQLLQANLAEAQRQLGLEHLAFHTLADAAGEKNAASLRSQADVLQGRRFGESARRSLLLQSLFNDRPGNLPAALDIYGDGAGQTGASTPQHGAVSGLSAQQASYNNYDELFGRRIALEADAVTGSRNSNGEQVRLGIGNDTVGLGIAQRQFRTGGFARFEDLDNSVWHGIVQWRPAKSTQAFVSHQAFDSRRGETFYPTLPWGMHDAIADRSRVTRLGLRHSLTDESELRALWSVQRTGQASDYYDLADPPGYLFSINGSSSAHGVELQYRRSNAGHATQWGVQQFRGRTIYSNGVDDTRNAQQLYAAWQQALGTHWQLDAGLGWGRVDRQDNTGGGNNIRLARWLPRLGAVWTPDAATHARLAAWQGMGVHAAGDATLVPVSLAGILPIRYGDDGKLVHGVGLGADRQLSHAWLLEAEAQRRKTDLPYLDWATGQQVLGRQQVDESRLALHWQPERRWTASLALDHERILNAPDITALDTVDEQNLRSQRLALRWFASERWTARLAWSHNRVTGTQRAFDPFFAPILLPYGGGFNQADADLDWKFAKDGSLTAGVRNAADARFQYLDIDRLNPRFSNGRLVYAKLKFAW